MGRLKYDWLNKVYKYLGGLFFGSVKSSKYLIIDQSENRKVISCFQDSHPFPYVSPGTRNKLLNTKWASEGYIARYIRTSVHDCATGVSFDPLFKILIFLNKNLHEQSGGLFKPNLIRVFFSLICGRAIFVKKLYWSPYGGKNYYHFWNDFICSVEKINKTVDDVSDYYVLDDLFNTKYFQSEVLGSKKFDRLNFKVYKSNQIIIAGETITYCAPWLDLHSLQSASSRFALTASPSEKTERIFVSRRPGNSRPVTNIKQLESFFEKSGYRVVFFEDTSIQQQIDLINSAASLVFIHGAAMTNCFLSGVSLNSKVSVYELTSSSYVNPVFGFLFKELSAQWVLVECGAFSEDGSFYVDIDYIFAAVGL